MFKTGRKGRISNELVAASCAAILAVYAAGTWRTRDADRRFGAEGQMRRPVQPARTPAADTPVASIPAAVVAPVAAAPPPSPTELEPAPRESVQAEAAPPPSAPPQSAASPPVSEPTSPVVAAAAVEQIAPGAEAEAIAEEADPTPTRARWLDGYYTGWGTSRHGDIQAFVRIEDNRIVDAGIATCETRYPCSVIENILLQPIDLQSAEVDRVSRATESADAYYYGLVMALENATTGTFRSKRP